MSRTTRIMKDRIPVFVRRAALALLAACFMSPASALAAQTNVPTATVTVEGQQMSYEDEVRLSAYYLSAAGIAKSAIVKPASEMPAASRYYYYAGKDATGQPIIWVSSPGPAQARDPGVSEEVQSEAMTAVFAAAFDTGKGDPAWQRVFSKVPRTPEAMRRFGHELETSMTRMSALTVAYSNDASKWIFANLREGTTRSQAAELLQSHVLSGTDKGDTTTVTLPLSFQPGCYFSMNVVVTFDSHNRVYKIDRSAPNPDCL